MSINEIIKMSANEAVSVDINRIKWADASDKPAWMTHEFTMDDIVANVRHARNGNIVCFYENDLEDYLKLWLTANYGANDGFRWIWDLEIAERKSVA